MKSIINTLVGEINGVYSEHEYMEGYHTFVIISENNLLKIKFTNTTLSLIHTC